MQIMSKTKIHLITKSNLFIEVAMQHVITQALTAKEL